MPRHEHITRFLLASFTLHGLLVVAAMYLIRPGLTELPVFTPVKLVNLPQPAKPLPLVRRPPAVKPALITPRPAIPEKQTVDKQVPAPKQFGTNSEIELPKTQPRSGVPEGAETGAGSGKTGSTPARTRPGPLPFLTQNDIDTLARKGMPERKPGDDSVTLDTDEFKFISYNRWLKIKVENVLKYPELAAISGYQGTLYIRFDILKDGSLGDVEVLKPSGYKILDDEAVRAIRESAPFQPLPDDWGMNRYSIRAAVIFYMNEGRLQ